MKRPLACLLLATVALAGLSAREPGQTRDVAVRGSDFAFTPGRIEVQRDDLVTISFTAADIPHSFTIDDYRISKRAGAGQTVTFEFRADRPGSFDYYCNLSADDRCRAMKGRLVVK